jgi:hypothetical protein
MSIHILGPHSSGSLSTTTNGQSFPITLTYLTREGTQALEGPQHDNLTRISALPIRSKLLALNKENSQQ